MQIDTRRKLWLTHKQLVLVFGLLERWDQLPLQQVKVNTGLPLGKLLVFTKAKQ
jgi:hypothetical protein